MEKRQGLHGKVILWLIVLVCGIAAVAGTSGTVSKKEEQVIITPEVFYGDPSIVEGMSVQLCNEYNGTLRWTTDFVMGQEENAQTTVEHLPGEAPLSPAEVTEIMMDAEFRVRTLLGGYAFGVNHNLTWYMGDSYESTRAWLNIRFEELLTDVMAQCEPGGSTVKTVWLKEYFDYYPILVNRPTSNMYTAIWKDGQVYMPKDGQEWAELVSQKMQEYFRIPVIEGDRVTVLLEKDALGKLSSVSFNAWTKDPIGGTHCRQITEAGIYFTMELPADQFDYSLVPGGYGLYFIPMIEEDGVLCLKLDELTTVMPLAADQTIVRLWSYGTGKILVMEQRMAENAVVFDIVDTSSGQVIQTIGSGVSPEWEPYDEDMLRVRNLLMRDDFMVIELSGGAFLVYEQQMDHTYRFCIAGDTAPYESMLYEWNRILSLLPYDQVGIARNGEYLAVSWFMLSDPEEIGSRESCDIYVAVFGKEDLAYFGVYRNSLSVGNEGQEYGGRIQGAVDDPITLSWPE
ncbi:MAG: hypothetical protein IKT45_05095 [Lachnospiraceae bacterium]|nr:hypothetical protein [Lachnospiraceae bacterium]